jgi:hypothetical protein
LSTTKDQRESFRAHIIKSVQNLISTASMYTKKSEGTPDLKTQEQPPAQTKVKLQEQDEDAPPPADPEEGEGPQADPAFIDVKPKAKVKPEDAFVQIPNIDATGRDMAKKAFLRIQKQILEAYSVLHDATDRNLFYKYLITNLKLHFDSFEDSLELKPEEPTTPEYEEEKQRKETEAGASTGAAPEGMPEAPEGEEAPPELEAEI